MSLRGAELRAWSVGGKALLWTPDPAVWNAVAPILFPVVGWTRGGEIRVDGARYPIGVHGFASARPFRIEALAADRVQLVDQWDAATLRSYPFRYRLVIDIALGPADLSCSACVTNTADVGEMPYAVGFHPGFRWPESASATLVFERSERARVPVITRDGLFAAGERDVPLTGTTLDLTRDLLAREALCFLAPHSRVFDVTIGGVGRLTLEHSDIPHLALWSRPPASFLCIESWTGHGDPEGFVGDLRVKPSMRLLPPGATARHTVRYTFAPDP